jgi:Flp pilus assembly protein TadB
MNMQAKAPFLFPLLFFIMVTMAIAFIVIMFLLGVHLIVIFAAAVALIEFASSILWYYKRKDMNL